MKRNKFVTTTLAFLLLLALFAVPAAAAGKIVNITKGVSHDSIQDAVDAAAKGDVIELAAGTYEQTDVITIDKALTLCSAAGATAVIEAGASQDAAIDVESPGVILEGLTVIGAASRSISIDFDEPAFSSETAARKFTLSGCTLEGDDSTGSAVVLYGTIKNAEIVLESNTVRNYTNFGLRSDSAHSFTDSTIRVLDNVFENIGEYGIDLDIPAIGTNMLIAGNKVTAKDEAVYLDDILGGSSLTIKDNTITSEKYEGIYFSDEIVESTVTIEGNTITSEGYEAIDFSDYIKKSTVTIKGNTITSEDEGIYFSYDIIESTVTIEGNTITSEEEEGIYFSDDIVESTVLIEGNTITSKEQGIDFSDYIKKSTVTIKGNSITSEDEGIYFNYGAVGITVFIEGNTITSEEEEGIWFDYPLKESTVTIKGNSITSAGGAIFFYYDVLNSELNISGNTILSDEGSGIYFDDYIEESTVTIEGNTILSVEGCGIYLEDDLDGSTITIKGNAITAQNGIYLYGEGVDSQVSIAGNIFKDNEVGICLECGDGFAFSIAFNAFIGNDDDITLDGPANLLALLNWWGAAEGPTGLDEKIAFAPWLAMLDVASDKAEGVVGENRTVTARLLDNTGALAETDLLAVRFTVTGAHNLTEVVPMVNGEAVFQYAGNPAGVDTITAEVLFAGEDVGLSGEAVQITWEEKPEEAGKELPRTSGMPSVLFALGLFLLVMATLLYRSRNVVAK